MFFVSLLRINAETYLCKGMYCCVFGVRMICRYIRALTILQPHPRRTHHTSHDSRRRCPQSLLTKYPSPLPLLL